MENATSISTYLELWVPRAHICISICTLFRCPRLCQRFARRSVEMTSNTTMDVSIDEKKTHTAGDVEIAPSQQEGEIVSESQYTPEEYKKVLRKIDRFLLPLMWFC